MVDNLHTDKGIQQNLRGNLGIIAGSGNFPLLVADSARKMGLKVIAVAHKGETFPELTNRVDSITWVKLGQIRLLIQAFKSNGVNDIVMAGGITKSNMFSNIKPDLKGLALASRLLVFHDDDILREVARELEGEDLNVISSIAFLPELIAPPGCLTKKRPDKEDRENIEF